MHLFLTSTAISGIPSDGDDIAQSAYVGRMIVEAEDLKRQGSPFKRGDMVSARPGIDFLCGEDRIKGSSLIRCEVKAVDFSDRAIKQGFDVVIEGWVAKLAGKPFAVRCADLMLLAR